MPRTGPSYSYTLCLASPLLFLILIHTRRHFYTASSMLFYPPLCLHLFIFLYFIVVSVHIPVILRLPYPAYLHIIKQAGILQRCHSRIPAAVHRPPTGNFLGGSRSVTWHNHDVIAVAIEHQIPAIVGPVRHSILGKFDAFIAVRGIPWDPLLHRPFLHCKTPPSSWLKDSSSSLSERISQFNNL